MLIFVYIRVCLCFVYKIPNPLPSQSFNPTEEPLPDPLAAVASIATATFWAHLVQPGARPQAQTWISAFWVEIPPPILPLLSPSVLRIWVSLAKSIPTPQPLLPSRRKTKSPHITNKNTNNLKSYWTARSKNLAVFICIYVSQKLPRKYGANFKSGKFPVNQKPRFA